VEGGFYIDADDIYLGGPIDHLFSDGRLKLQPFCYDIATSQMVPPCTFVNEGSDLMSWIFYFNTTPMIAAPNHPVIARALLNCTEALEEEFINGLPEVQATTGPGNLTKSVFEVLHESGSQESMLVVHDWERLSTSKWPLSYPERVPPFPAVRNLRHSARNAGRTRPRCNRAIKPICTRDNHRGISFFRRSSCGRRRFGDHGCGYAS
jgi:hypothetical protein